MNPKNSLIIAIGIMVIACGIVFIDLKRNDDSPPSEAIAEAEDTRASDRINDNRKLETKQEREARESLALADRGKLISFWVKQASAGFGRTMKYLVTDLDIDAGRATEVEKIFAKREKELASLLAKMTSGEAADERENFKKICALLRNKGLREDLEGVLSKEQLETFDRRESRRERETVEARAYRDIAEINAVISMSDSQKREALGVLLKQAPERVEAEADARAFMSLTYGPLAAEMESSSFRGLTHMLNEGMDEGSPDLDIYSAEYQQLVEERKAERIESELSALRDVLDEQQLNRYREHLEAQPAW